MKQEELMKGLRGIMRTLFPELAAGTHLPHKARVIAVHGVAGAVRADGLGSRRYSLDVEPLTPDGEPDPDRPPLLDVPLEVSWAGPGRGVFALPETGATVRVCYYGGSAAHPYIDGIVPDGFSVPAVQAGEYLIHHSPAVRISVQPGGEIQIVSDQEVRVQSSQKVVVDAPRVELAGDAAGVARLNDEVEVQVLMGSSAGTWKGRITRASGKVFAG